MRHARQYVDLLFVKLIPLMSLILDIALIVIRQHYAISDVSGLRSEMDDRGQKQVIGEMSS